jgi:hypothetical protein
LIAFDTPQNRVYPILRAAQRRADNGAAEAKNMTVGELRLLLRDYDADTLGNPLSGTKIAQMSERVLVAGK